MWGDSGPIDGFEVVVCWVLGHEWPREYTESGESADASRCQRCQKRRVTERPSSEDGSDTR